MAAPTAVSLYEQSVWPALWAALQPPSHESATQHALRCSRALQHAVTHALLRLLHCGAPSSSSPALSGCESTDEVSLSTVNAVTAQLLLHSSQEGTSPTQPSVTSAAEVERLFVLMCTAIQLVAQSPASVLSLDKVSASVVSGAAAVPAVGQLHPGVASASRAIVAGIYGVACHLCDSSSSSSNTTTKTAAAAATTTSAAAQHHVQPLWFTFLFIYLQQLSAHTPKDTTAYTDFIAACAKEYKRRLSSTTISSDDENEEGDVSDSASAYALSAANTASSMDLRLDCAQCCSANLKACELAALLAWSHVSADLLKDTVARTRFRRAALLYKSFVPVMPTQAPTLSFLLADLLCSYSRSWEAYMRSVAPGELDETLAQQLSRYSSRSIADAKPPRSSSSLSPSSQRQWASCQQLVKAYGDRLSLLLGEGTPHGHLVATILCAVLTSLYLLPHTHPTGVAAEDVAGFAAAGSGGSVKTATTQNGMSPRSGASGSPAPPPSAAAPAAAAAVTRGRRDEEAGVLELETAYHLPRRHASVATADNNHTTTTTAAVTSLGAGAATTTSSDDGVGLSEAEWQLRHYAPFGQLLAHAHLSDVQKIHLFAVAATEMRVGRTPAQQCDHVRHVALTLLYCGVASWDLALLVYHFAFTPLKAFAGPDANPAPPLPTLLLARYTAAVAQFAEQSKAELIVHTPFVDMSMIHSNFGGGDGVRHGGVLGSPGRRSHPAQAPFASSAAATAVIPSRGELQTPRFIAMMYADPVLLSWRAHLAAAEAALTPAAQTNAAVVGILGAAAPAAASTVSALPPGATDALLSPCCMVRDLVVGGHYALAAAAMVYLSDKPFSDATLSLSNTNNSTSGSSGSGGGAAAAAPMNVLLPPRRAFPQNISVVYYVSVVLRRWLQRWETLQECAAPAMDALSMEIVAVLRSLLPLLATVQTFLANQTLLMRVAGQLAWVAKACRDTRTTTRELAIAALAVVEKTMMLFMMPCLRVLPPAPMVYDLMDDVVDVFTSLSTPQQEQVQPSLPLSTTPSSQDGTTTTTVATPATTSAASSASPAAAAYGPSPAAPLHMMEWLETLLPAPSLVATYRTKQQQQQYAEKAAAGQMHTRPLAIVYPHDALLRKEREALFLQSMKRLNAENIEEYRAALRPILYAEPLLVAHRLFVQAIGYNNNFLHIHTRLLRGLPRTVLMLVVQQGLLLMARYAAEEKITDTSGGESRIALLATFLATLWRDNTASLDGAVLVRRVEYALRSNHSDEVLLGTELLKALLVVMAHRTMEHEEKYSAAQLQALSEAPSTTSLFGRGAMTSFRMRLWKDEGSPLLLLSPTDVFVTARQALVEALQQPCAAPVRRSDHHDKDEDNEEENDNSSRGESREETSLTVGQLLLVHLCRLHTRIHELQRDLDGEAESVLLASAARFNAINDMIVVVEDLMPVPKSSSSSPHVLDRLCSLVRGVALPHISSFLEAQMRRKALAHVSGEAATQRPAAQEHLLAADAVYRVSVAELVKGTENAVTLHGAPSPTCSLLRYLTAAHYTHSSTPYDSARQELQQCMQRARQLLSAYQVRPPSSTPRRGGGAGAAAAAAAMHAPAVLASRGDPARARRAAAICAWLEESSERITAEAAAHQRLTASSAAARDLLLESFVSEFVPSPADSSAEAVRQASDRLIDLAVSYLLPRTVLNLREAAAVAAFFTWLFQQADAAEQHGEPAASARTTTATATAAAAAPAVAAVDAQSLRRAATDLALTYVSAAFTYFVAFTDGECKRIGHVLQRLLETADLGAQRQLRQRLLQQPAEVQARLHPVLVLLGKTGETTMGAHGTAASGQAGSGAGAVASDQHAGKTGGKGHNAAAATNDPMSSAMYLQRFMGVAAATASKPPVNGAEATAEPSTHDATPRLPQPEPLLSLIAARGLASRAKENEEEEAAQHDESAASKLADAAQRAAQEEQSATSAASLSPLRDSAIPLQLEAYLCRAMVQLFTHDSDVPAYVRRNQLLLLEQLDKSAFPSTLCSAAVLVRAVEPHASKAKSYYALASAVLKALRLNHRQRREAQQAVQLLSRGEGSNDVGSGGGGDRTAAVRTTPAAAAAELHTHWRLREHYMMQLLQDEVAQLLHDQHVRRRPIEDEEDEEDEEKDEEGGEDQAEESDHAGGGGDSTRQHEHDDGADEAEEEENGSNAARSASDGSGLEEEEDEEEDDEDDGSGYSDEEDEGDEESRSQSPENDAGSDSEGDGSQGTRKRARQEMEE